MSARNRRDRERRESPTVHIEGPRDHRLVIEMDSEPDRCLWHFWAEGGGCKGKARWYNGQWRACDLHRHHDDRPILARRPRRE